MRCLVGPKDDIDRYRKVYVTLVHRIDPERFLVSQLDVYSVHDEFITIVLDKRAILEIPLTWEGNENLKSVLGSLTPPLSSMSFGERTKRVFEMSYQKPSEVIFFSDPISMNYDGLF